MVRCTMNDLLPTPEKLIFEILDGLVFGISTFLLITWFTDISKKIKKSRVRIYADIRLTI